MQECVQINPTAWRIEDGGVRFFLLCGTEKAALVDSGMNAPDARQIAQSLTDLPLIGYAASLMNEDYRARVLSWDDPKEQGDPLGGRTDPLFRKTAGSEWNLSAKRSHL